MSVDTAEESKRLVATEGLPFRVLSDSDGHVLRAFGLEHHAGGLQGQTIAVPAQVLIRSDGTVVWWHAARRITDRAPPQRTLAAIADLAS